jgi:hypothetical protein
MLNDSTHRWVFGNPMELLIIPAGSQLTLSLRRGNQVLLDMHLDANQDSALVAFGAIVKPLSEMNKEVK